MDERSLVSINCIVRPGLEKSVRRAASEVPSQKPKYSLTDYNFSDSYFEMSCHISKRWLLHITKMKHNRIIRGFSMADVFRDMTHGSTQCWQQIKGTRSLRMHYYYYYYIKQTYNYFKLKLTIISPDFHKHFYSVCTLCVCVCVCVCVYIYIYLYIMKFGIRIYIYIYIHMLIILKELTILVIQYLI